jgi:hypothetical protein
MVLPVYNASQEGGMKNKYIDVIYRNNRNEQTCNSINYLKKFIQVKSLARDYMLAGSEGQW